MYRRLNPLRKLLNSIGQLSLRVFDPLQLLRNCSLNNEVHLELGVDLRCELQMQTVPDISPQIHRDPLQTVRLWNPSNRFTMKRPSHQTMRINARYDVPPALNPTQHCAGPKRKSG